MASDIPFEEVMRQRFSSTSGRVSS
jgi:hypothetical protein